jgi:hypothetical protein
MNSEAQTVSIHITWKTVLLAVVALMVVGWCTWVLINKPRTAPVASTKGGAVPVQTIAGAQVGGRTTTVVSGATGGTVQVRTPQNTTVAEKVLPVTKQGNGYVCNGKEVDPNATGCTTDGGEIFSSAPDTLNSNGQDQSR